MRAAFQRALLSSHTLRPDMNDFDSWLDALFDALQPLYIQFALYQNVWEHPDPQKIARYRVETEFWRDDDPVLQMALRGAPPTRHELHAALEHPARSHFGETVRLGVRVLRDASRFWKRETDSVPDVSQG